MLLDGFIPRVSIRQDSNDASRIDPGFLRCPSKTGVRHATDLSYLGIEVYDDNRYIQF